MSIKSIEPNTLKIGDYLEKKRSEGRECFVIPEYQRPYAWTVANCEKLLDDIDEYIKAGNFGDNYFFGAIIISYQKDETERVLIDGQQRTTTFFLLFKAILDKINDLLGQEYIAKAVVDPKTKGIISGLGTFRKAIMNRLYDCDEFIDSLPDESLDRPYYEAFSKLENRSVNEFKENKEDFISIMKSYTFAEAESRVHKIKYKKFDNKYSNCFRNYKFFHEALFNEDSTFILTFTKHLLQSCQLIEIGSWSDEQAIAMFNSLNSDGLPLTDSDIILAKLYSHALDKTEFQNAWKALRENIAILEQGGICNMDSLLNQYMYYLRNKDGEPRSEEGQGINAAVPGVRRYFLDQAKKRLKDPSLFCSDMGKIVEGWLTVKDDPLVQTLLRLNGNSRLFLAATFCLFDVKTDDGLNKTFEFARLLLRLFVILELEGTTYSNVRFKSFLIGESCNLLHEAKDISVIKSEFDNHINSTWKRSDLRKNVIDYDGNILVYVNELLFAMAKGASLQGTESAEIEHIMPQSDKKNPGVWKQAGMLDQEEFDEYLNKLGNKILLEKKINIKVGNSWFNDKINGSLENRWGYKDSAFPIAQALVASYGTSALPKEAWTKEDIEKTTEKISGRILDFVFGTL